MLKTVLIILKTSIGTMNEEVVKNTKSDALKGKLSKIDKNS